MDRKDEDVIVKRALDGDSRAFAVLVDGHKRKVFNLALRILGNREDAEEIAQDAFVKAFHSLNKFRGEGTFGAWILRITYNSALTFIKKIRNVTVPLDRPGIEHQVINEQPLLSDALHEEERKKILLFALGQLKDEEKGALTLFYFHGHSVKEISDIMQLAESNVKIHLFRGRKKMVAELNMIMKEELIDLL